MTQKRSNLLFWVVAITFGLLAALLMSASNIVHAAPEAIPMTITGVIDGPLPGGTPKMIELYVLSNDISDLSEYGIGSANNGGGSDGEEFTFPADSVAAGEFIYITTDITSTVNYFGFTPANLYTAGAAAINGDDAIELFYLGNVLDTFGDINTDGTDTAWEYADGWAYRQSSTGPDTTTFNISNWYFSGIDALDGTTTNNGSFPIGTYDPAGTPITVTPTITPTITTTPTPTMTPTVVTTPAPGDPVIIINEIMANPSTVSDSVGEWFEVYNPGAAAFDLDGCELSDAGTNSHIISGTLSVPAGGYAVLGASIISATAPVDYEYSSFQLSNGDDEIFITCGGVLIDSVAYDTAAGWTVPNGSSIEFDQSATDNSLAGNWAVAITPYSGSADFGTPGQRNDAQIPTAISLNGINTGSITLFTALVALTLGSIGLTATVIVSKR